MSKLLSASKLVIIAIACQICGLLIYDSTHNLGLYNILTPPILSGYDRFGRLTVFFSSLAVTFIFFICYHISHYIKITLSLGKLRLSSSHPWLFYAIFIIFILCSLPSLAKTYSSQKEIAKVRAILSSDATIIHAGGTIQGYTYTNSLDSLVNSYELNNHIVEIDFDFTSDNAIVCSHENDLSNITYADFMDTKLPGGFSPMSLSDIISFMKEHSDLYVVTDGKRKNPDILEVMGQEIPQELKDRFIIQIYSSSEFASARKLGFNNIIFTLYLLEGEEKSNESIAKALKSNDILAVTFFESRLQEADFYANISSLNVPMCVHTVDDFDSMVKDISEYKVSGIYTNNTDNQSFREAIRK